MTLISSYAGQKCLSSLGAIVQGHLSGNVVTGSRVSSLTLVRASGELAVGRVNIGGPKLGVVCMRRMSCRRWSSMVYRQLGVRCSG
jgi:hypothetical protein